MTLRYHRSRVTTCAESCPVPECPIVCDTTVLLYLGRIGQIGLLPGLYDPVWVPESVRLELDMGRLLRRDTVDPETLPWATSVSVSQVIIDALPPNRLGPGEQAVIAYANSRQGSVAGLDDLRARQLAEALGLTVAGTLGLLLRAKRAGLVPAVLPLLHAAVAQGFHISPDLYRDVLDLAGEAA
jgi:predicted nucleic acid-binding protein